MKALEIDLRATQDTRWDLRRQFTNACGKACPLAFLVSVDLSGGSLEVQLRIQHTTHHS
jgi:hypothetical protein